MNRLITWLLGTSGERSIEHSIYKGVCITTLVGNFGLTIAYIINRLTLDTLIGCLALALSGFLYYFARNRNSYFNRSFYLFFSILSIISYYKDFGIHRSVPYSCLVYFIAMLAYSPIKWYLRILSFNLIVIFAVILTVHFFPNFVINSDLSDNALNIDRIFGVPTTLIFCFVCIFFLRNSYDKQKDIVEKISQQKSMFFINLSHEIRTPLTLIENYLRKYIETKGEDDDLVIIRQNIIKMRQDVLEYLNFENLERGLVTYNKIEILPLDLLLEEKIKLFNPYAENKSITLKHLIEHNIYIQGNIQGIDQVLNNLLENAVKHTPEMMEIIVSLKTFEKSAKLEIRNSGVVIQKDQLQHLFEPFFQLSHEKSNSQGIGMGLYTVKKILENTGGKINVHSNQNEVIVSVDLPLSSNPGHTLPSPEYVSTIKMNKLTKVKDSAYLTNRPSLMLVEDNIELLGFLTGELSENYNVFIADNGITAMQKLENIPTPDLIISDIMMDKMDGYTLFENTLNDKRYFHIPFIFLTAKSNPEEKIISIKMGALDFITKPFVINDLKLKIKAIIEQKSRISEAAVLNLKKQFSDEHFSKISNQHDEILNRNSQKYKLTLREKEIVVYVQKGNNYETISERLNISKRTVVNHIQNIYKKTGSSTKIDLLQKMYS